MKLRLILKLVECAIDLSHQWTLIYITSQDYITCTFTFSLEQLLALIGSKVLCLELNPAKLNLHFFIMHINFDVDKSYPRPYFWKLHYLFCSKVPFRLPEIACSIILYLLLFSNPDMTKRFRFTCFCFYIFSWYLKNWTCF